MVTENRLVWYSSSTLDNWKSQSYEKTFLYPRPVVRVTLSFVSLYKQVIAEECGYRYGYLFYCS